MALKYTILLKPTWELILLHKTSSRTLLRYDVSKLMSASLLLRLKKEALAAVDRQQVLTPGVDWNVLVNNVVIMVPLSQWLKRDEVKMK
jgi:hypothetical protein